MTNKFSHLLIYFNPSAERSRLCAERVKAVAERLGAGCEFAELGEARSSLDEKLERCDLVAVLGGDGTMLSAAVPAAKAGKPVLGINLGKLGFMTAFEAAAIEDESTLAAVLAGAYIEDSRALLRVSVKRSDTNVFSAPALNDAVVGPRELGRTVTVSLFSEGQHISTLRGDGAIAATATGSTAYSLSAGGPIIDPRADSMVLTPICAHTPYARPIVLPLNVGAEIRVSERASLTVDGQPGPALEPGDIVKTERFEKNIILIRLKNYSFFDIISAKLWQKPTTEV